MASDFVWAIDENGRPTKCRAKPENRGKRNCNHRSHQEEGQSLEDFMQENGFECGSMFSKPEVTLSPYRMTDEEKEQLREVKTKKDLEDEEFDGGYLHLQEALWNDMDKRYFASEYGYKMKELNSVLARDSYVVLDEAEGYSFGSIVDTATFKELDAKGIACDTGVASLNYLAETKGFTATTDVYVLPYYMRQGVEDSFGEMIDSDITKNYKHLFSTKTNPDNAQKAYSQLLTNKDKTSKNGIYARRSLADRMSGKKGIWRSELEGFSIPYAGQAVVTPTLDMAHDEVRVPVAMAVDIFRPTIADNLRKHSFSGEQIAEIFDDAKRFQADVSPITKNLVNRALVEENVRVLMNRRPSLHDASLMGFKPKVSDGPSIQVNPLICKQYGMDFDGDEGFIIGLNNPDLSEIVDRELSPDNFKMRPRAQREVAMRPEKDAMLGLANLLKRRA